MHTSIQHLTSKFPRNAYPTQTTHPTLPNQSRPDDQESSSSLTEAVAASYAAERGRGQANELTRSSFREFLRSQANTTVRLDTQRFGAYLFTTPDRATTFFLVPGRVPLALAEDIESDELLTSAVRRSRRERDRTFTVPSGAARTRSMDIVPGLGGMGDALAGSRPSVGPSPRATSSSSSSSSAAGFVSTSTDNSSGAGTAKVSAEEAGAAARDTLPGGHPVSVSTNRCTADAVVNAFRLAGIAVTPELLFALAGARNPSRSAASASAAAAASVSASYSLAQAVATGGEVPREKLGEIVPRYSRAQLVRPRGLPLHRGLYVLSSAAARDPSRTEVLLASVDRVEIDGTIRWVSFGL